MKFRLLFLATFLALVSCSGDDSGTETSSESKALKEVSYYGNDGNDMVNELVKFENNKVSERYIYNEEGDVEYKDIYTYDGKGRLLNRKFSPDYGSLEQTFIYDGMGRIGVINLIQGPTYKEETVFDYSEASKIKQTKSTFIDYQVSTIIRTVYYLLPDGRVYKIVKNNESVEVVYQDNNIVTLTTSQMQGGNVISTQVLNLTYDDQIEVKGEFMNMYCNLFGDNKANHVIYNGSFQIAKDKYITAANATEIEYAFDVDGFPVQQTFYSNGQDYSKYVITYTK